MSSFHSFDSPKEVLDNLCAHNLVSVEFCDHDSEYEHARFETNMNYYDPKQENHEAVLIFAGYGDYVGSTVDMANQKYIETQYPELLESGAIEYRSSGYGYVAMVIFFTRPSVTRSGLLDDMNQLCDYPLFDDKYLSEIEQELLDETWEQWADYDFTRKINELCDSDFDGQEWLETLYWDMLRNGHGGHDYAEGTSMYVNIDGLIDEYSETVIPLIRSNVEALESDEFELSHDYGENYKSVWTVKPTNEVLKEIVSNGLSTMTPLPYDLANNCQNCYYPPVCQVTDKASNTYKLCGDCYNKLMGYAPKCKNECGKNATTRLQLALIPMGEDIHTLTYCEDCKDILIAHYT